MPEKTAEILFNRYMLQGFRLGEVTTYAPTSREEARAGYDSKLVGLSQFRELYLQFKSPAYSPGKGRFTIRTMEHQHLRLKRYPVKTAYYVAHTFASLTEFTEAQRGIQQAVDFLKYFVAVSASTLPEDVAFLQYHKPTSHRESPKIAYKMSSDGETRTARHPIIGESWMRGNQLIELFKADRIGVLVQLPEVEANTTLFDEERLALAMPADAQRGRVWSVSPQVVDRLFPDAGGTDYGLHVRRFLPGG